MNYIISIQGPSIAAKIAKEFKVKTLYSSANVLKADEIDAMVTAIDDYEQKMFVYAYDRQIGAFRTDTINPVIAAVARLTGDSAIMKKGLTAFLSGQSLSAVRAGLETYLQMTCYLKHF